MIPTENPYSELPFPKQDIYEEIDRIFIHPLFVRSDILKRFLSFIVDKTVSGNSNWLKEYTIAVSVLHRSNDFKPNEDGIVRIHAGRLRRALNRYYCEEGISDPIRISIPKGSYIPVFESNSIVPEVLESSLAGIADESVTIAVIPFNHLQGDPFDNALVDGLGLQFSQALMQLKCFSVIAYGITRSLAERSNDIKEITESLDAVYVVTGDVQAMGDCLRIYIQMIHAPTSKLLWGQIYDKNVSAADIFKVQDEIVASIVPGIADAYILKQHESRYHHSLNGGEDSYPLTAQRLIAPPSLAKLKTM